MEQFSSQNSIGRLIEWQGRDIISLMDDMKIPYDKDNAVLAEVPYAFLVTLCVFMLVRYQLTGRHHWLALASAVAAGATLVKPVGQLMLGICVLVALHTAWRGCVHGKAAHQRTRLNVICRSLALAVAPGAAILAPVMFLNLRHSCNPAQTARSVFAG